MVQLILGSQSPRRKRILEGFSLNFKQISSNFYESTIIFDGDPARYVMAQSYGKAESLAQKHKKTAILTADTTVYYEGNLYEKPEDETAAFNTLAVLSGKWHQVFTGVTLFYNDEFFQGFEETRVLFNDLTDNQIRTYLNKIEWQDKAGGYAIQSAGGLLIKKIDGALDNVVGLPMNIVSTLLDKIGISLWDYLKNLPS